jgi:Putative transposase
VPLRTPATVGQNRLRRLADGRVRLELKRPWSDGTTHLLFEPMEFLEELAAVTPRPEINLVLYHGVLAPRAHWRPEVVAYRSTERDRATDPRVEGEGAPRPRYWTWALLMRRAFDLDVLRCPRCAGRMQLIATIDDPAMIQRILAHLGLPGAREDPQAPLPLTAAGVEQPALPGVTF